jgi:predicted phage terminase large subunit-like protein
MSDPETEYKVWWRNIYKNGENEEDGYIWHERWNKDVDLRRRKEVSKKHFAAQYLNKIIITEDQVLPFDTVKFIHATQIEEHGGKWYIKEKREDSVDPVLTEVKLHCVVDPAATCNKDSDYTAIVVGGKSQDKRLFVFECKLFRVPSEKWIHEMYKLLDKYKLKAVHLETVAFAVALIDVIKAKFPEYYPVAIRQYKPSQSSTKKDRIESGLEPLLENGMLYMTTWLASYTELVDQFNFFPNDTVHDDGLDAIQTLNEVARPILDGTMNKAPQAKINTRFGGYR